MFEPIEIHEAFNQLKIDRADLMIDGVEYTYSRTAKNAFLFGKENEELTPYNLYFPNLARKIENCDDQMIFELEETIRKELTEAGINVVEIPCIAPNGEVPTRYCGCIGQGYKEWRFNRMWTYWVAKGPAIPPEDAKRLNEKFNDIIRVEGCAGGMGVSGFGVGLYHIDNAQGLKALADLIKEIMVR